MPQTRRHFLQSAALLAGSALAAPASLRKGVKVSAHLWVYASRFPPNWDCSPILDQVFSEIKAAGYDGLELMDVLLKPDDAVSRIRALSRQYRLPVTGCSFEAPMWDRARHPDILKHAMRTLDRLQELGGDTFGVSVGHARHVKTPDELDAQAELLRQLIPYAPARGITLNLHNHTYEVENGMHDLKGTLARLPDVKLGPDINWLNRGGVDPVAFIQTYGKQIVYLHLRDQKTSGKWAEALGDGTTDFAAIARALEPFRFRGRVAVELAFDEPTTRPVAESWKLSRAYVREVFGW